MTSKVQGAVARIVIAGGAPATAVDDAAAGMPEGSPVPSGEREAPVRGLTILRVIIVAPLLAVALLVGVLLAEGGEHDTGPVCVTPGGAAVQTVPCVTP